MKYQSTFTVPSAIQPTVVYIIHRISLGKRLEFVREVREAAQKTEFLEAGGDAREQLEALCLHSEIDRLYLRMGLAGVEGIEIDGRPADAQLLFDEGPPELCEEALRLVKKEFSLSEDERKN